MKKRLFAELTDSIRQAGEIKRGNKKASRRFEYPDVDVKAVRVLTDLSQEAFADLLGIGVGTLRHWEQGDHPPTGAARTLLHVLHQEPKATLRALSQLVTHPKSSSR